MNVSYREAYLALRQIEKGYIESFTVKKQRAYMKKIDRTLPAVALVGERGVGKSTLMLGRRVDQENALYLTAESNSIQVLGLFEFVWYCYREHGVKKFYIDEIFKYSGRQLEIKQLIDMLSDAQIVFSGSSALALYEGMADLSRRVQVYQIRTLNFSEFLSLKHEIEIPECTLDELLETNGSILDSYVGRVKETVRLEYLRAGCYPFGFSLSEAQLSAQLEQTLMQIIIEDLPTYAGFSSVSLQKLKNIFYFLAQIPPSELSLSGLSKKIGLDHKVVENSLYYLSNVGVIHHIYKHGTLSDKVRKKSKLLFGNPNIYYLYKTQPLIGTVRESAFLNFVSTAGYIDISTPHEGDYIIEYNGKKIHFEIGGPNKTRKQISRTGGYIVSDTILPKGGKTIPLWMFGCIRS